MIKLFLKTELWYKYSRSCFLILFILAFFLGLLYIYFMNLAVLKTAERNINLNKLTDIKRSFQDLETSYINKLEKLDVFYAESLGFIESEPNIYIYRDKAMVQR